MADQENEDRPDERSDAQAERLGIPGDQINFGNVIANAVRQAKVATADGQKRGWLPLGARNIGGRVRALAQHPKNPSRLYAGMAQGGLWRTEDGGDSWIPCGLPEDSFPVGCLASAAADDDTVYVGSGEPINRFGRANRYPGGVGILRYSHARDRFDVEVAAPPLGPPAPAGPPLPPGFAANYSRIQIDPSDPTRYWIG